MTTRVFTATDNLHQPARKTRLSAGYDLHAAEHVTIPSQARATVRTGAYLGPDFPADHAALVAPRSGLAARHGITVLNAPGVLDADYKGEINVILYNTGTTPVTFSNGDRIAQALVIPYRVGADETVNTERGTGGLGSTGL